MQTKLDQFFEDRNTSKSTQQHYRASVKIYEELNGQSLDSLIEEADIEEENGIRWKKRRIKQRLLDFRNYLYQHRAEGTARQYFADVRTIYKHFEIELQELPTYTSKNIDKTYEMSYEDILTREELIDGYHEANNVVKCIILFASSSGLSKVDIFNQTVRDFIEGCGLDGDNLQTQLQQLKNQRNLIPCFRGFRQKTNKAYITFCSPEASKHIVQYLIGRNAKIRQAYEKGESEYSSLKLVGNAEKDKLLKNVSFVERNLKQKNRQTKKLVLQNVLINYEAGQIQLYNLKKLKSSARTVEKENLYLHQTVTENFVPLIVGMSTIVEKIIHCGKEELLRNEQWEIHQENGKIVAKLYGKEMMPLVSSVEEDLIMMKNLMKFITSDLSNMKIQDMMLITLYCCVIGVIIGYIPIKTDLSCLEKINLEITTGWTEYGKDGEEISDTQRYKCMGNAVTTSVVTFVINKMFGVSDE